MGTLVGLVVFAFLVWVVWKLAKAPDVNKDDVVDHKDVVEAAKQVVAEVKAEAVKVADVNKDGKVDLADAKAVVKKVKKGRKKKKAE